MTKLQHFYEIGIEFLLIYMSVWLLKIIPQDAPISDKVWLYGACVCASISLILDIPIFTLRIFIAEFDQHIRQRGK